MELAHGLIGVHRVHNEAFKRLGGIAAVTIHSTLGMKPIDRFGVDLSRIRFLSPSQDTDELFYAEDTRTVKKDNTFSFQGERYETPIDLRGKQVVVRYERHRKGAVIVYDNGRRLGQARLLDAVANGLARRREK